MRPRPQRRLILVVGMAMHLTLAAAPLHGQGYRARLDVGGSILEVRGLVRDSLPEEQVAGQGLRRRLPNGTVVTCAPGGFCHWYRSGDVRTLSPLTQRLTGAAWGDVQGLSLHVDLRGRLGSGEDWPLAEQEVEAAEAYLRLVREDLRIKAGRQVRSDGLGVRNFDGLSVAWSGADPLTLTAFGGWSLAPSLNVPRTSGSLAEVESVPPVKRGLLVGLGAAGRLGSRISARAVYQREMRTDGAALYSDRIAVDGRALLDPVTVSASAEYDLALGVLNEGRLRAELPVTDRLEARLEYRGYTPFFELWTIWGAFSPVGFQESRGAMAADLRELDLTLEVSGAYRWYGETRGGAGFVPLREDGWRAAVDGRWMRDGWIVSGGYRAEAGPGAARFGGDVAVGRRFGDGGRLTLRGLSTQTFGEFRLGERFVTGIGLDGSVRLGAIRVSGGGGLYSLDERERSSPDWTQARAHLRMSYTFGTEPEPRIPSDHGDEAESHD